MVEVDGIWFEVTGAGPVVVVPRLNVDWTQVDLTALTDRCRVVVVAPRGFGPSGRQGGYDGTGFVRDVQRVLEHLSIERYATFGYSMNGAMAARLAVADHRVTGVACGGFPLTADLSGMGSRQRGRNAAARTDPEAWAELVATYDPEAAVAFWDDVAHLRASSLVEPGCPVRAWWGSEDTVLASLIDPAQLERDLRTRGIEYDVLPGLGHDGALERLDLVLPAIAEWLADESGRAGWSNEA